MDFPCYETSLPSRVGEKAFHSRLEGPADLDFLRYDVVLNLKIFSKIRSLLAKVRGQNVTMFYFNQLGCYPWNTPPEVPINSGLL